MKSAEYLRCLRPLDAISFQENAYSSIFLRKENTTKRRLCFGPPIFGSILAGVKMIVGTFFPVSFKCKLSLKSNVVPRYFSDG